MYRSVYTRIQLKTMSELQEIEMNLAPLVESKPNDTVLETGNAPIHDSNEAHDESETTTVTATPTNINDLLRSIINTKKSKLRLHSVTKPNPMQQVIIPATSTGATAKQIMKQHVKQNVGDVSTTTTYSSHGKRMRTNHSYGNYIRMTPSVEKSSINTFPTPTPTKRTWPADFRSDIGSKDEIIGGPWNNLILTPMASSTATATVAAAAEKPKEINLAEIVTGVLQEVLTGKITNIENIIGKLRINYEEKNVFENAKKQQIIILNFEDDTMRPVIKLEEKQMDIIQKWYDHCDIFVDIEETKATIPENITTDDLNEDWFPEIDYNGKDEYLYDYLPLVINNIITKRTIKSMKRNYTPLSAMAKPKHPFDALKLPPKLQNKTVSDNNNDNFKPDEASRVTIYSIGEITIPENIEKTFSSEFLGGFNEPTKHNQPNGLSTLQHVIDNPYDRTEFSTTIESYNSQTIQVSKLATNDVGFEPYNQNYNCLFPGFAAASVSVEVIEEEIEKAKPKTKAYVIINGKFMQTLTLLNPSEDELHIIEKHPEFGFSKLFVHETNNQCILDYVQTEFDTWKFNTLVELQTKIQMLSNFIEFSNKQIDETMIVNKEEIKIKKFLQSKYILDNDINRKMKASALCDAILDAKIVQVPPNKLAAFKTRVSKYLKDLGLEKKRYNDGIYYYGISEKMGGFRDNKLTLDVTELVRLRAEQLIVNN